MTTQSNVIKAVLHDVNNNVDVAVCDYFALQAWALYVVVLSRTEMHVAFGARELNKYTPYHKVYSYLLYNEDVLRFNSGLIQKYRVVLNANISYCDKELTDVFAKGFWTDEKWNHATVFRP